MTSLSRRVRIGYALGGVASGTYGTVPGLILMPFLTDYLGVAAAMAGFIVFLPKAWDFILSPIAGRMSDSSLNPHGRRRPFIIRGGLLLALVFIVLFFGPTHPPLFAGGWVLLFSLGCATAYAFYQVPYLAMSAEITNDYAERTQLTTWRAVVFSLTILVSGGAAPLLVEMTHGVIGYRIMSVVMAMLIALGVVGLWFGTRGAPLTREESATGRWLDQLKIVLGNQHGRVLILAFICQAAAIGMVLSGVIYLASQVVRVPGASALTFLCFVGPAALCAPLWLRISGRLGKKHAYILTTAIMATGFLLLLTTRSGALSALLISAAIAGIGFAGAQIFPLAILPDVASDDAKASGVNRIGMITGVWSGFELLGLALGPALLGAILAFGGYVEAVGGAMQQTDTAKWAIVLSVSVVPAALCLLSIIPLSRYRLDALLHGKQTKLK